VPTYWFYLRFGVKTGHGPIFFWGECPGGISGDAGNAACRDDSRLVRTMVFTHSVSKIMIILVPRWPACPLATLRPAGASVSVKKGTCRNPGSRNYGRRR